MSLVITSGYGASQLVPTSGYGAQVLVCGTEVRLDSVELPADNVVRARYTRTPATSGAAAGDATVVGNYTLTNSATGAVIAITQASAVLADAEVIDLFLAEDLAPGVYTLTVVDTLVSADVPPFPINAPLAYTFEVTKVEQDPISLGATNDACVDALRKNMNPAYRRRDNWEAMLAGLAEGDCIVKDIAQKAFDQMFVSSASAKYLDTRASDRGVGRPAKTAIADDLFRQLVIAVVNSKLTQEAFQDVLEVLYGQDAVRAYAETDLEETFVLFEGADLDLLIDEAQVVKVVFERADFSILRRATAEEVAAVITRQLEVAGTLAFAVAVTDPETGGERVRIYSGSRGLASTVRVTGGTAQIFLQFPSNRFPVTGTPALPSWTITTQAPNRLRLAPVSASWYNLSQVQVDDYLVLIGAEFDPANRGSFKIVDVRYAFDLGTGALDQWIEVEHPTGVAETVQQCDVEALQIFEPRRRTLYDSPSHAVVTQQNGEALVSIAATTQAVNRQALTGAYAQVNTALSVDSVDRDPTGTVVVTTSAAHNMAVGDHFQLDDVLPSVLVPPAAVAGTPSSLLGTPDTERLGTSDQSGITQWSTDGSLNRASTQAVRDLDGDLWVQGGMAQDSAGAITEVHEVAVHNVVQTTEAADGTRSHDYRWFNRVNALFPTAGAALDVVPAADPDHPGKVLMDGGYLDHPWADNAGAGYADSYLLEKRVFREAVLIEEQLSDAEGILGALAYYATNNPVSGDFLTVTDGTTTRTYGFGAGGDVTVTIGASASDTMDNLATDINGDGSAAWGALATTGLTDLNSKVVVIYEDAVGAKPSPLRVYGTFTTQAEHQAVTYATATTVEFDYTGGVTADVPTSDPGSGRAGVNRNVDELVDNETHRVLAISGIRRWDDGGGMWDSLIQFVDEAAASGTPTTQLADAAMANLTRTGGSDRLNVATDHVELFAPSTETWSVLTALRVPRMMHRQVSIATDESLVIGGRQPVLETTRDAISANPAVDQWDFEETGATYAGPVAVPNAGNPRSPGKIGYGVTVSSPMKASAGAPQTALNASLLGDYAIVGWMTSSTGIVFKNRGTIGTTEAENLLVAFGVDATTDRFFVAWQHGDGGGNVLETRLFTATRAANMPVAHDANGPRYYQFALTKTSTGGTTTWSLYLNGVFQESVTGTDPSGGGSGLWEFGPTDETGASPELGEGAFTGAVDQVLIDAGLTGITAATILAMHNEEVGVAYDLPEDLDRMPVGKVLNTCEVVDNVTGYLRTVGSMSDARFGFGVVRLPDGRVIVAGGVGYNPSQVAQPVTDAQRALELRTAEVWDPGLETWSPLAPMSDPHSWPAMAYVAEENRVYIAGGFTSTKVEYLDVRTMTWHVAAEGLSVVRSHAAGGLSGTDVVVLAGGGTPQSTNVEQTSAVSHQSGTAAETIRAGGLNAIHKATAVTATTVTFETPDHQHFTSMAAGAALTPVAAATSTIPGPFVYDTKGGMGVTGTKGTTAQAMNQGQTHASVVLTTGGAAPFSVDGGYIVFNYGQSTQVGPVRYLGKLSDDELILDASFVFPVTVPSGAIVTLLQTASAFVPDAPEDVGSFYLTASPAGRVAAQKLLDAIHAAGIELEVEVRYPGDRGMGAEGFPARDNYKLSDKVWVWGGDEVDEELEVARGV